MPVDWPALLRIARVEVNSVVCSLPRDLRAEAGRLPVTLERRPGSALRRDGVEPDTLGLFIGEPFSETGMTTAPLPAQIILFLENIWEQPARRSRFIARRFAPPFCMNWVITSAWTKVISKSADWNRRPRVIFHLRRQIFVFTCATTGKMSLRLPSEWI